LKLSKNVPFGKKKLKITFNSLYGIFCFETLRQSFREDSFFIYLSIPFMGFFVLKLLSIAGSLAIIYALAFQFPLWDFLF